MQGEKDGTALCEKSPNQKIAELLKQRKAELGTPFIDELKDKAKLGRMTIIEYMEGNVRVYATGMKILKAADAILNKRRKKLLKSA